MLTENSNKGSAEIMIALGLLVVIGIIYGSASFSIKSRLTVTTSNLQKMQAFYATEMNAGIQVLESFDFKTKLQALLDALSK